MKWLVPYTLERGDIVVTSSLSVCGAGPSRRLKGLPLQPKRTFYCYSIKLDWKFEMIDMIEKEDPVISEEEAAQYDRQIRLWGLDAQKRSVSFT